MKKTRADQRKFHYVYKISRDDGAYYIGIHSTDNLEDGYFGSGQRLWKSIRYHGREKHSKVILEFFSTRQLAKDKEKELVNEQTLKDSQCLNLCLGGGGGSTYGRPITEEHREKLRQAKLGKKLSPEHIAAQTAGKIGKKHSEERNRKKSEHMKGKPNLAASKLQKPCTVDGITIYSSVRDLVAALGHGKNGVKSSNFRFVEA